MSRRIQLQVLLGVIVFAGVWDGGQAQSVTQTSVQDSPRIATTAADYSAPAPGAIVLAAAAQTAGGPLPGNQRRVASIAGDTAHGSGVLGDSPSGALRTRHSAPVSDARSEPRDSIPSFSPSTIPEPTRGTMLLCGLAVVAFMARRKSTLVKS